MQGYPVKYVPFPVERSYIVVNSVVRLLAVPRHIVDIEHHLIWRTWLRLLVGNYYGISIYLGLFSGSNLVMLDISCPQLSFNVW